MGHARRCSHVEKSYKHVKPITQDQNPTFLLRQEEKKWSFKGLLWDTKI